MSGTIKGKKILTLHEVSVRLWNRQILSGINWEICGGQHWAILGRNGSGKTTLVRLLSGEIPYQSGEIYCPVQPEFKKSVSYVSFEQQKSILTKEWDNDHARSFSGNSHDLLTVKALLESACGEDAAIAAVMQQTGITPLGERGVRYLSNGEIRKVLLAKALLRSPRYLILDEPFDGLDKNARVQFAALIAAIAAGGMMVFLVVHRTDEIPAFITHILYLKQGVIVQISERVPFLNSCRETAGSTAFDITQSLPDKEALHKLAYGQWNKQEPNLRGKKEKLISMNNVTVQYGDVTVFKNLNWQMHRGENWAVCGPNGSGKSTLVSLITGDNPQGYRNDIVLFGRKRGSGESIWELKAHTGLVTPGLQVQYNKPIPVQEVVLSGFYDSIGLYRYPAAGQTEAAEKVLRLLGIVFLAGRFFNRLSYGERQLVLIARALVKAPEILILDEPTQGLDTDHRRHLLAVIDVVTAVEAVNLIYISHLEDEMPACITHKLVLGDQVL